MVIISEVVTETTSAMEETPSPVIKSEPENLSFGVEKGFPVDLAGDFSGTTHKLVEEPEMAGNLKFSASPSITAEMGAIIPYVPKILEGDHSKKGLHAFLFNTLKAEMKQYVSELKYTTAMEAFARIPKEVLNVAPLSSIKISDGYQNDAQLYSQLSVQKRRVPTICLGERTFSFTFPRQFISDDKQVDDLIQNERGRQYTFSERLDGWRIERRQRINGRFDLYYYHLKSQTIYRSTLEVLNFLLHEARKERRKSAGKGKADETDAYSKSEVADQRKRSLSFDADSNRKQKQKIENSINESEVEKLCRESRENLSSMADPSRVYESESEFYKLSPEERREEVEKFLMDSYNNMRKSKYLSNREEELISEEEYEDEDDNDEQHDFHISPRQEEKEQYPKNDNGSPVEEGAESDDETVSEIMVEEEEKKQDEPVAEEKENGKVGEEKEKGKVGEEKGKGKVGEEKSQAADADADAIADAEIEEAFAELERYPVRDNSITGISSSYFPTCSFDDYDMICSLPPPHDPKDPHSYPNYPKKDDKL